MLIPAQVDFRKVTPMPSSANDIALLKRAVRVAEELSEAENGVRKNGAVVVDTRGAVIAEGANRKPASFSWAVNPSLQRVTSDDASWIYYLLEHAERDAIGAAYRDRENPKGGTIYCTLFPCADCARAIVASGIKRVVVRNSDQDSSRNEKWKAHFEYSKILFECSGVAVDLIDDAELTTPSV
jgi:dCMP deaminase